MEELIDLIATDGSPADVSDKIKQLLYTKASERVNDARPEVSAMMFGNPEQTEDDE
jgi:hypothetical protein